MTDELKQRIEEAAARAAAAAVEGELAKIERQAAKAAARERNKQAWNDKHAAELEERRLAKEAEKADRREAYHRDNPHSDVAFNLQMAPKMGIEVEGRPVEDVLADVAAWRAERQSYMAGLPPLEEQLKTAPSVNPVRE